MPQTQVYLALYLVGLSAMLVAYLPFSPMTVDLLNLPRSCQLQIYRKRRWLWTTGCVSFGILALLLLPGSGTGTAVIWWWVTGSTVALLGVLYWSGYVPFVMTPPGTSTLLEPGSAGAFASPSDVVLGVEVGGETRAYLRDQIARPHYFRDVVGGKPLTVTYCILCNSAAAFDSSLDGRTMNLTCVTAYNNNILFEDATSGNFIQQLDGRVIEGPARGRALPMLPVAITTWREWTRLHPDTKLYYAPATKVRDRLVNRMLAWMIPIPRLAARAKPWHRIRGILDTRLPAMAFVLGVEVDGARCAYAMSELPHEPVLNDEVGDLPVVILFDIDRDFAQVFERRLDDQVLTFRRGHPGLLAFDTVTGSIWDCSGVAIDGPLVGRRLSPVPHFNRLFWFSWALFKPGTRLWPALSSAPSATAT